ncbi:hypothetical protein LCGC14_2327780 [marine sediment metagenome]|uniref:ABC transporter domain-containing protein n=1 Tax=marine sediment metagenome TaxID=412755 RepID=A0A0F9ETD8_9ZZZZ
MAEVKLSSLTKNFGDITAVDNMDLEIKDKEFFVLLGPTGAGKSTTLRLVAGLEIPDEGEVFLEGNNVNELSPASRDVAFVFQYYTLYPNYTVRKNLEFPLRSDLRKLSEEEITNKVAEVARVLHIEHLLDRGTVNLSGGEMQRVAIGRAIVRSPKVFLMDEPLSNLDAKLREEMRAELSSGRTLIAGEKALVFHVSDKHGKLLEKYGKRQIILGIRPEDIEISKEKKGPNPFGCRIHFKQSLGVEDVYNLKIDNTMFKATAPTKIMAKVGETVYANINMERAHLFDPDTERRIG